MIENNGKKYFTTIEIVELINDETTELHNKWVEKHPNYKEVILLEQVNRILYEAKKNKEISVVEYTKSEKSSKKYFAFLIDDVIAYISKDKAELKPCNVKFIDKE